MSAIRLLVLGAVRQHGRAHGYQVRSDLESWGAHEWSNAKPGSIYHALKQMATQGLLLAHELAPSTAGGPPRTEYELTQRGTEEFFSLLRAALASYDQKLDVVSSGIGFIVHLPRDEAVALLKKRVEGFAEWRKSVTDYYTPEDGPGQHGHIGEIMHLWVHTADAGAEWTRGLIQRIEGGAYSFEGEGVVVGAADGADVDRADEPVLGSVVGARDGHGGVVRAVGEELDATVVEGAEAGDSVPVADVAVVQD